MTRARGWGTALLALLVVVFLVVVTLISVGWLFGETRRDAETVEGIAAVDVRLTSGHVELIGSTQPSVTVELARTGSPLHRPNVSVQRDGERLLIVSDCRSILGPVAVGGCRTDVRLFLPDTLPAVAHTQRGTVAATGMRAATRLTTDRGPARVVGQSGELQVSTLAGAVEVRDLTAASTDLRTREGRIDVVVTAPGPLLSMRTGGGDIAVTLPPGSYAFDADTAGGELTLAEGISNDPASPNRIRVRTDGGDVVATVPG
jgi:Putative adhesin